jgi:uncharacterized protein YacL (UPF0231 family)
MARKGKRRKFSNSQIVVVRFCDRKIVGKVVLIRPVGKKFFYDVEGEDGKIYTELLVDSAMNHCIDTYLTRLFYQKYKMDEAGIPEIEDDEVPTLKTSKISKVNDEIEVVEESEEVVIEEEEILFEDDEMDPNY